MGGMGGRMELDGDRYGDSEHGKGVGLDVSGHGDRGLIGRGGRFR